MCHSCGCLGYMWLSRALFRIGWRRVMRRTNFSRTSIGKFRLYWITSMSLEPRFRHTCDDALEDNSFLYRIGSNILPLPCGKFNLRATRARWGSRSGPPSNLVVELKANTSTFEYERHRVCLSLKTSNDEPSHVPLHARTLRGVALSS